MQLNKLLVENQQLKEEKAGLHRVIAELKAGTYVEEASKPKTDTAVADSHTKTAPTSTKAVPTRLNSVTAQKASGVQDRLFTRDEFADVVTDEELMNLLNEES